MEHKGAQEAVCSPSIAQSGSYCLAAVMAEMMDALVTASGPLVVRQAMHQSHGQFGFHGCKQIADLPLADGIRRRPKSSRCKRPGHRLLAIC